MEPHDAQSRLWDALIIGGGLAGLSAAIYLGRAQRSTLILDSGNSMAVWEPEVRNYLGFPEGIAGEALIQKGRDQARGHQAERVEDEIIGAAGSLGGFRLQGRNASYTGRRLLLATGIFHIPPDIPGVTECLGHSMFFCKDCDGIRVKGRRITVFGWNDEAVEYALAMLAYSPRVAIVTNGREGAWSAAHARWIEEYALPLFREPIVEVEHDGCHLRALHFQNDTRLETDALFTTRGDIIHNAFAKALGVRLDESGEIAVDSCQETSVPGLYAAGCVTPANCQMIIAAGQGAIAAQAINRALFEEDLGNHKLRRMREEQIANGSVAPAVTEV